MKKLSAIASLVILLLCLTTACGRKGPEAPPDVTPPAVILTSPINGAQNVAINSSITITFSEAMDASTINEQTITLSMGTGNVPGSVTYSDTTAVFKPSSSLNPGTTYTITVDGGVKDVAGNAMVTPVGFIFFTGTALTPTTMSLSAPAVPYGTDGSVTVTVQFSSRDTHWKCVIECRRRNTDDANTCWRVHNLHYSQPERGHSYLKRSLC